MPEIRGKVHFLGRKMPKNTGGLGNKTDICGSKGCINMTFQIYILNSLIF